VPHSSIRPQKAVEQPLVVVTATAGGSTFADVGETSIPVSSARPRKPRAVTPAVIAREWLALLPNVDDIDIAVAQCRKK